MNGESLVVQSTQTLMLTGVTGYRAVYGVDGIEGREVTFTLPVVALVKPAGGPIQAAVLTADGLAVPVKSETIGGRFLGVQAVPS